MLNSNHIINYHNQSVILIQIKFINIIITLVCQRRYKIGSCEVFELPEYLKDTGVQWCRRRRFDLWVRKIPWRRKWQPTPVFLPGKSHGQKRLVGYSPWSHKRVGHDTTKQYSFHKRLILAYESES